MNDNRIEFRDYMAVGLVKHTARDTDVIVAALVSTMGEESAIAERSNQQNKGLINYLMRDRHGSPFEHNSMTFLVNAPIFVARQFMRHRTGWSYNEESGRYRELQPVFYMPSRSRNLVQTGKTGAYVFEPGSPDQYGVLASSFESTCTKAWRCYQRMLEQGIAREVARMVLPVTTYTTFYATCNARSLMHLLSLRTAHTDSKFPSHPQNEIGMVADQMEEHFKRLMPDTYEAYNAHGRVAP